jgi:hypothetical protein
MLYMQSCDGTGKEVALIFSDTDSLKELHQFRCKVRAPRYALHEKLAGNKRDRAYLTLYGRPRVEAMGMISKERVFEAPIDRVLWERQQPHIMRRHPKPFLTPEHDSIVDADNADKENIA